MNVLDITEETSTTEAVKTLKAHGFTDARICGKLKLSRSELKRIKAGIEDTAELEDVSEEEDAEK